MAVVRSRVATTVSYYALRSFVWLIANAYWRIDIRGKHKVPTTGAFILCPIHRSNLDGMLTALCTRRRMVYLTKKEAFIPVVGPVIRVLGAIPVNRDVPDRKSLKQCIELLTDGYPLVLFPEGGRRDGAAVQELKEGATYLALRANVPVVPVGIGGSEKANPRRTIVPRPAKITLVIGEPIRLERGGDTLAREEIRAATQLLHAGLQKVYDEARDLTAAHE